LNSINVNSTLEPNGLSRDDGKPPDGMTLVPWIKDQPLVCDVTVVDTLAESYVLKTSEVSGFAAEMACNRKHSKYSSIISSNYIFKGLSFETLGPWCKETIDFINVIGNRLIAESGDSKSKKFIFERISLVIQRIVNQKCYVIMLSINKFKKSVLKKMPLCQNANDIPTTGQTSVTDFDDSTLYCDSTVNILLLNCFHSINISI
jgi:hypothetical protein